VIGAEGLIVGVTAGLRQVVGLYMPPVNQSLGIGIEPFSTSMAVANLLWGIGGVVAGAIADRYGAGRVTVAGIVLMIAGYFMLYAAQTGPDLMWTLADLRASRRPPGCRGLIGAEGPDLPETVVALRSGHIGYTFGPLRRMHRCRGRSVTWKTNVFVS